MQQTDRRGGVFMIFVSVVFVAIAAVISHGQAPLRTYLVPAIPAFFGLIKLLRREPAPP